MKLNQTHTLITGGASGLGEACAHLFTKNASKVTVIDKDRRGAALAEKIGASFFECDICDELAVKPALAASIQAQGVPRILINCAGIAPAKRVVGRLGAMPLADFEKVIAINLTGTFNMIRLVAAAMIEHASERSELEECGVILNTASIAAYEGQIGQAAYAASKSAIVGMTLPIAREFSKHKIRVNTIAPGIMATPMLAAITPAVQDSLAAQMPFPSRLGHPEEYAALAKHIVENALINGETIRLDGAIRMQAQ